MNKKNKENEEIKNFLEKIFIWPKELEIKVPYKRMHDDNEGRNEYLEIIFGPDGDAWVKINKKIIFLSQDQSALRFRVPGGGGGVSGRTYKALATLAYAIYLDNKDYPQMEGK
jgi:hypothetical protein